MKIDYWFYDRYVEPSTPRSSTRHVRNEDKLRSPKGMRPQMTKSTHCTPRPLKLCPFQRFRDLWIVLSTISLCPVAKPAPF
jgi:hypothetical protein